MTESEASEHDELTLQMVDYSETDAKRIMEASRGIASRIHEYIQDACKPDMVALIFTSKFVATSLLAFSYGLAQEIDSKETVQ